MTPTLAQIDAAIPTKRELYCLRSANRKCGLSYRSSCRRNEGLDTAKDLRDKGLLYLHDKGERPFGRYVWRTTEAGRKLLEMVEG